ncbi:MAG TPA: glycosyltransferase family 39 protein, partial [Candidatus Acidoferrales bacterium]|nr:glycosyltransferase family 39 protein [Candidatus Acidoferrales bacterium]
MSRIRSWLEREPWFALLLAAAVAARLYNFRHPPDDAHEWRQTQTLMYSASYGHGAGWLTPFSNWNGAPPHPGVLELPLYSILAYLTSAPFGLLASARTWSFASSVAAIYVFDRLCVRLEHPRRRTATLLFALAPVAIFYGHAVQPESLLLLLVVAAAYGLVLGAGAGWRWTLLGGVALAAATLIKPTALVMLAPPLALQAWRLSSLPARGEGREGSWLPAGLVLAGSAAVALAWGLYVRGVLLAADPLWYSVSTAPGWVFGELQLRFHPFLYETLTQRLAMILLPPLAAGLILIAAFGRRGHAWWWAWAAGGLLSVLVFSRLNAVHFYYQLPAVPALAALAAYGFPAWPRSLRARGLAAAGLLTAAALGCRQLYAENPIYHDAGAALASVASPGPVLALSSAGGAAWYPVVLFYSGHDGWNLPLDASAEQVAAHPACDLVMVFDRPSPPPPVPPGWTETKRTSEYVLARSSLPACGEGREGT